MHVSLPWSWIVGAIAALIVIAGFAASRLRRGVSSLEPPAPPLDDSGTFPVLTPPEEPAEILRPPDEPELPITTAALDDVPTEAEAGESSGGSGEAASGAGASAAAAKPAASGGLTPTTPSSELPLDPLPADDELDDALDDALDRVVK